MSPDFKNSHYANICAVITIDVCLSTDDRWQQTQHTVNGRLIKVQAHKGGILLSSRLLALIDQNFPAYLAAQLIPHPSQVISGI